jgi:hypothetical protein
VTNISTIFRTMPERYQPGRLSEERTFYFSIGDFKYTVYLDATACRVEEGKTTDQADVVLKTTPKIFERLVVAGKLPGPIDIARGRFKTNDPAGLQALKDVFDF